jgi:lysozyme
MTRDDITQNQFDALVSFAYNVGLEAFRKSTLLKKVNANPNDKLISNQFLRWNKSRGRVLQGLTNRRIEEARIYFAHLNG